MTGIKPQVSLPLKATMDAIWKITVWDRLACRVRRHRNGQIIKPKIEKYIVFIPQKPSK